MIALHPMNCCRKSVPQSTDNHLSAGRVDTSEAYWAIYRRVPLFAGYLSRATESSNSTSALIARYSSRKYSRVCVDTAKRGQGLQRLALVLAHQDVSRGSRQEEHADTEDHGWCHLQRKWDPPRGFALSGAAAWTNVVPRVELPAGFRPPVYGMPGAHRTPPMYCVPYSSQ